MSDDIGYAGKVITSAKIALLDSFKSISVNVRLFCIAVAIDIVLLILYGFISGSYLSRINEYLQAIGIVAISAKGLDYGDPSASLSALFINPYTKPYLYSMLIMFVLLSISIYFLLSVLFGASTSIGFSLKDITLSKVRQFIVKLLITNIPWMLIIIILNVVSFYLFFIRTVSKTFGMESGNSMIFDSISVILFVFFFMISISIRGKHNFRTTFKVGILKVHYILPFFLLLASGVLVISYLAYFIAMLKITFILTLYQAIVVVGFLLYARIAFKKYLQLIIA